MKFTKYNMDFEIPEAKLGNYFFGNIIMPYSLMLGFTFPDYLQYSTFILQKMTYDEVKMTYSFADYLTLDVSHKKTLYFEEYSLSSNLDEGFYRIKAGSYYSNSLIEAKNISEINTGIYLADNDFYNLIDNTNDKFKE